jgi:hypothetical protein
VSIAIVGMNGEYSGDGVDGNATNGGIEVMQNVADENELMKSIGVNEMLKSRALQGRRGI